MISSTSPRLPRVIIVPAAILLIMIIGIAVYLMIRLNAMSSNAVSIVTKPSAQETTISGSDATETTLASIVGTPSDLDTDYNIDVLDPSSDPIYQISQIHPDTINILLFSSDARSWEKEGRSDSTILLSYNSRKGTVKMLSFMRDCWVKIERHGWNRINTAFAFGGVGLAVNTVNENFGLDIQKYVTIRFEDFAEIIDKIGGIEIYLTKAEIEYINRYTPDVKKLDTKEGLKFLNGAQTLTHCRNRSIGNGDFDRTRRQRETMVVVMKKVKTLRDPAALASFVNFALEKVETNLKPSEVLKLATDVLGVENLSMNMDKIPFDDTWHYADEDGRSVIALDLAKNKALLADFLYK